MAPVLGMEQDIGVINYNDRQKSTRSVIKRCNGVLKIRFRCLLKHRVLHYKHEKCSKIINVCTVLHNMCIANNIPLPPDENADQIDFGMYNINWNNEEGAIDIPNRNAELTAGRRARINLIIRFFA